MNTRNIFDLLSLENIGNQIIKARKRRGLTQSQLSKFASVDLSTLNQLEQGKVKVTEKYIQKISDALGYLDPLDLFGLRGIQIGYVNPPSQEMELLKKVAELCDKEVVNFKEYHSNSTLMESLRKPDELHLGFIATIEFLTRQFELVPVAKITQSPDFIFVATYAVKRDFGIKTDNQKLEHFFRELLSEILRLKIVDKDSDYDFTFYPQWVL